MSANRPFEFPIGGIDDGVVRLRLRSDADMPAVIAACQDPEITRWISIPTGYDRTLAELFAAEADQEMTEGTGLHLLVVDAEDDSLVGSAGIVEHVPTQQRCQIGYWLTPGARGRGLMRKSVRLLCEWIFDELRIVRIEAHVEPENAASRAVVEGCGFHNEGTLRSLFFDKGHRRDVISYSLLAGELPQAA